MTCCLQKMPPGDTAALPITQTIGIEVCSWRDRKGFDSHSCAHRVMGTLPTPIMQDRLCIISMPLLARFSQLVMIRMLHSVFYTSHRGPTLYFPRAWVHCTHLVQCVDPSFGDIIEFYNFWLALAARIGCVCWENRSSTLFFLVLEDFVT